MLDSYRHKGMRKKLVDSIRRKGIQDAGVLKALDTIPRHLFLDSSFLEFAYDDKPFPIGSGQTISQPYTVAFQSELLQVKQGQKVLEIGTGSGYQACVLAEMGAKVYSVERQKKLYLKTKEFLKKLPYNVKLFYGDGGKGVPSFAPYDRILITAAAPDIPKALLDQLRTGGFLVVPVGGGDVQTMLRIKKLGNDEFETEEFGAFRFVPMLQNKAND
ncbi:MAG: protein-L-isoaspartate O-methyltransferase [Bacteroidetes bacterium]|nr:MAG: protein-L-isoaspartate O-methyltransferase [Bacteroidota bacterium]